MEKRSTIDIDSLVKNMLEGNWKELVLPKNGESELEKAAKEFGIKMAQLRKFFEKIKKAKKPEDLLELVPKAVYSARRQLVKEEFVKFIEKSVSIIVSEESKEKFENFQRGMEYLIAYAKSK